MDTDKKNFIICDSLGVDDVAIDKVTLFRMERMSDDTFWIRLYREGDKDVVFWVGGKPAIQVSYDFDAEEGDVTDVEVTGQNAPALAST